MTYIYWISAIRKSEGRVPGAADNAPGGNISQRFEQDPGMHVTDSQAREDAERYGRMLADTGRYSSVGLYTITSSSDPSPKLVKYF